MIRVQKQSAVLGQYRSWGQVTFAGSGAGGAKQPRNRAAAVQNAARASGLDGEDRESATSGCEIHLVTPEEQ